MKKFLTIVMTVIILVAAITSSTVTFAASMPTTTITSVSYTHLLTDTEFWLIDSVDDLPQARFELIERYSTI